MFYNKKYFKKKLEREREEFKTYHFQDFSSDDKDYHFKSVSCVCL